MSTAACKLTVTFDPSGIRPVGEHPARARRPPLPSFASGVGHSREPLRAHSARLFGPSTRFAPKFRASGCCVGVGQLPRRAIVSRLGVPALGRRFAPFTPLVPFCDDPYTVALGVG